MNHSDWCNESHEFIKNFIHKTQIVSDDENDSRDSLEIPDGTFDPDIMNLSILSQSESNLSGINKELQQFETFCPKKFYKCEQK